MWYGDVADIVDAHVLDATRTRVAAKMRINSSWMGMHVLYVRVPTSLS